jgi:hypothetical protein
MEYKHTPHLVSGDPDRLLSNTILSVLMKCDNLIFLSHYMLSKLIIKMQCFTSHFCKMESPIQWMYYTVPVSVTGLLKLAEDRN